MVDNENPNPRPETFDSDEWRREVAVEQGIFNGVMAEAAKTGNWPEKPGDAVSRTFIPPHSHPSGHVRDTEPRDSDLDPDWNAPVTVPPKVEQDRINENIKKARHSLRRGAAAQEYEYLQQFSPRQQIAILRAREEREQRQ